MCNTMSQNIFTWLIQRVSLQEVLIAPDVLLKSEAGGCNRTRIVSLLTFGYPRSGR